MKYRKAERLEIGKKIGQGSLTVAQAAALYGISFYTAREYYRNYKAAADASEADGASVQAVKQSVRGRYDSMTKEELIEKLLQIQEIIDTN